MARLQAKIPNDWNGEDWLCVRIHWPDSAQWFALLSNMLVSPARGRTWDASTGTIVDAQHVGQQIIERNIHYIQCGDIMDCDDLRDCLGTPTPEWNPTLTCEQIRACLADLLDPNNAQGENLALWPGLEEPDYSEACAIATGVRAAVAALRDDIAVQLTDPLMTAGALAAAIAGILALFTPLAPGGFLVIALSGAILIGGSSWFDSTFTDDALDDFKCVVFNSIIDNGELNNAAIDDIHARIDMSFGDLVLREFFHTFVNLAGKNGIMNTVAAYSVDMNALDCSECIDDVLISVLETNEGNTPIVSYEGSGWYSIQAAHASLNGTNYWTIELYPDACANIVDAELIGHQGVGISSAAWHCPPTCDWTTRNPTPTGLAWFIGHDINSSPCGSQPPYGYGLWVRGFYTTEPFILRIKLAYT